MKLLALDLSSSVGHALLERGGPPSFGTYVLTGHDMARRIGGFAVWLDESFAVMKYEAIAWERPLITKTDTVDLLELLFGLVGVCYAHAGRRDLLWREVTVIEAKVALTGKPKATKDEMLYAARRVAGWKVSDHHQADAGAVGICADAQLWPKVAA